MAGQRQPEAEPAGGVDDALVLGNTLVQFAEILSRHGYRYLLIAQSEGGGASSFVADTDSKEALVERVAYFANELETLDVAIIRGHDEEE